jgi:calcineurin-like phosphoesterase family protein
MPNIFVTSDTHFHHENIIKYCNRPFSCVEEMDEVLIKNWNSVVKPQDKVYHLGDVYFPKKEKSDWLFSRLNGTKRLILGNHDNGKDQTLHKYFKEIYLWRFLKEFGLLLTHVPIHPDSLPSKLKYNVHGHTHNSKSPALPFKCVSVELTNYTPKPIEELM